MIFRYLIILLVFLLAGCNRPEHKGPAKPLVIATLFPLYDFSRTIAGDKLEVRLLLPPGVEAHSFEPRPDDIMMISSARIFIYTNRYMEPWAERILNSISNKSLCVVDASQGVALKQAQPGGEHEHDAHAHRESGNTDPHIWLDFGNAQTIVANILDGLVAADPANAAYYRQNAAQLQEKLANLDQRYRQGLSSCDSRVILHAGHFTFGYLARRYNLEYQALSGVSSEAEPSASQMAEMARRIKRLKARYVFAEELLSPRMAETLAKEAGVGVLNLHGAHNVSREDLERGVSFIDLMEFNLKNLQKGLGCREK